MLEGLDGQLAVQHEGQIIPTQEAPQRPNILRNFTERTVHTPAPHIDSNGLGRRWAEKLAQLEVDVPRDTADGNGAGRVRKTVTPRRRKPTPLQTARCVVAKLKMCENAKLDLTHRQAGCILVGTSDRRCGPQEVRA